MPWQLLEQLTEWELAPQLLCQPPVPLARAEHLAVQILCSRSSFQDVAVYGNAVK